MARTLRLTALLALFTPVAALAQGTTTASLTGTVLDNAGQPLPGATLIALHQPSGTQYGGVSRGDGRYDLQGLRVGGPYMVTASFIGFATGTESDLTLTLGQAQVVNFTLTEGAAQIAEVEVTATEDPVLSASRTGARTSVDRATLERVPTISRSLSDIARLTPQAAGAGSEGISVGGRNNRYNNLQVDGAVLNDVFGLGGTAGVPGGQANAQPISLDAIEAFNVDIAPYDVRYSGFTGASVNAITRSGTNQFSGSLRYLGRNEALAGELPVAASGGTFEDRRLNDFRDQYFVGTLGGPILRDRLFFFANVEYQDQTTSADAGLTGSSAPNLFPVADSVLQDIVTIADTAYGYDAGSFGDYGDGSDNLKLLGKLDWNLSPAHRATLRLNYVNAGDDQGVTRTTRAFDLSNRLYVFNSDLFSGVAEVQSRLSDRAFNEARLVYTSTRDNRDVQAEPFPEVTIQVATTGETVRLGIERFSQANALDQDVFEFTDNFSYYTGPHTITVGTSNQLYRFDNLFIQDYYGSYTFRSVEDFAAGTPRAYTFSYSLIEGDAQPRSEFTAAQLGLYAQDEFAVTPQLRLTGGLRVDLPVFPTEPLYNPALQETVAINDSTSLPAAFGGAYDTREVPNGQFLFSPRLGFNFDVTGDRTTQLRGGTGIFSGRTPFVWISNQYANTGVDFGRVNASASGSGNLGPIFVGNPDPQAQPRPGMTPGLSPVATSEINLTAEDFKFPQVWRSNLAVDQALPGGFIASLEGIYSKSLNEVDYTNVNLLLDEDRYPGGLAFDGRPVYGNADFGGSISRTVQGRPLNADPRFTDALLLRNTDEGYEYNVTAGLRRDATGDGPLGGLSGSLSYTYGRATAVNNATSSRAISNWQFNEAFDINNADLGTADFEVRHRILGSLFYRQAYAGRFATSVGLVLDSRAGEPFSWIYNGDANADRQVGNDRIYVPAAEDEVVLVTQNWDALNGFIEGESSLADARGEAAERNSARTPWRSLLDLQLTQEIGTLRGQRVELSANVLNVLNFLNPDWGRIYFARNQALQVLNFYGYVDPQDVGTSITVSDGGTPNDPSDDTLLPIEAGDVGKPVIGFVPASSDRNGDGEVDRLDLFEFTPVSSRWQLQFGIRYTF